MEYSHFGDVEQRVALIDHWQVAVADDNAVNRGEDRFFAIAENIADTGDGVALVDFAAGW